MREPFNAYSHLAGVVLALVGTVVLALSWNGEPARLVGALVFGISMVLLYTSSTVYHAVRVSAQALAALRRLDHAAIFLFIAGSYTPLFLQSLEGPWKTWGLVLVWTLALLGLIFRVVALRAPRWLYTLSYLGLGWVVVFFIPQLRLPTEAWVWIGAGGVAYSLGAVIYALKKPNPWPRLMGFHGLWHLFVLAGSVCVYLGVLRVYA